MSSDIFLNEKPENEGRLQDLAVFGVIVMLITYLAVGNWLEHRKVKLFIIRLL